MSNITSLYREYFQKSRIFLYPVLEIKKGVSITPIQTHVSWPEGGYQAKDKKLISLYLLNQVDVSTDQEKKDNKRVFERNEKAYKSFEKFRLLDHKMFHDYKQVEETILPANISFKTPGEVNQGVYIFNFDGHDKDWSHFLEGRYSKMSPELKKKIKDFFRPSGNNFVYIESFLHPEKYWSLYSELLGVSMEVLKDVGELTSPPDLEREALKISIKNLNTIIK